MDFRSSVRHKSDSCPGVTFDIRRVSFEARLDLLRKLRENGSKLEYLQGGSGLEDQLNAAILEREIEGLLVSWGLVGIEGLSIDGEAAEPAAMLSMGPEALVREIAARVREQLGLSEEERKNC